MTTYKEIFGKQIKQLSTDPTDAGAEGQVWYNTTLGSFRSVLSVGAWSSGDNINTAGYGAAGTGTQTAGLIAGRNAVTPSADVPSNATEEYDGSAWTGGGNLSNARYYAGSLGTQTSSLITGGDNRPPGTSTNTFTELYDGSSWTAGTAYPTAVVLASGFGTRAAGVMCNGGPYSSTTNEYNGSWTSGGSLNTARRWIGTAGTQTAGLAFGGQIPPSGYSTNVTEEYGGTSWTSGANLNVTRAVNAVGGGINQDGSQTNALAAGGYQSSGSPKSYFNETESYDGTSWSAKANMAAARGYGTGGGSGSAGIVVGAYTGSLTSATEEFNYSIYSPIAATWASGGNMGTARYGINYGIGTQTAALVAGGYPGPMSTAEIYDGSSWTAITNLPYVIHDAMGIGTQTAAYVVGGAPTTNNVRKWDGSSWSTTPSISSGREDAASSGSASDGFIAGGSSVATEEWNGSSWTGGGNLPVSLNHNQGAGTASAGLSFGGRAPGYLTTTNEYDGSSWTGGGNLNVGRSLFVGGGTQTLAFAACAQPPPGPSAITELYNGTAWSVAPNLATGRYTGGGTGATSSAAMVNGGQVGDNVGMTTTEEFTGEIQALDYKTLTSS